LANVLNQQANQKNQNLSTLGTLLGNQTARKIQNQQQANASAAGVNQANTELAQKNQENRGKGISSAISGVASAVGLGGGKGGGSGGGAEGAGGGMGETPMMAAQGGLIPGDHKQNDVVPAMLSPGEIVLPRSIVQSPEAAAQAKAFVEAIKKSGNGRK
jgi:hypothetical protein